jgi:hypothetical protein
MGGKARMSEEKVKRTIGGKVDHYEEWELKDFGKTRQAMYI